MRPKLIIFIITFLFTTGLLTNSTYAAATYDWKGGSSTAWDTPTNWSPSRTTPLSSDALQIGVVSFTNAPTITTSTSSASTSCASITFGTATSSITLTVNGTLSVSGAILQNPPAISLLGLGGTITTTLAGTGSITCGSMQVGSTTFLSVGAITTNQVNLVSTISSLQINGDLSIYGTSNSVVIILTLLQINNSAFYLRGGTTTIGGQIYTNTSAASGGILNISLLSSATATFTIDVPSGSTLTPRLVLTNAAPIKSTSNAGSIDFYNNGGGSGTCTVEYAGSSQAVYTESTTQLDITPTAYQNLNFSATGTKTINSGDLTVYGDWSSASTSGKVDAVTNNPNVIFKGVTQSLSDAGSDAGNGVLFKNVFVQNSGTKTMSGSGKFAVSSSGILTMGGTATLAAGGVLTLNS
ncbi:hypothetical protein, partial [Mucilaginibacter sp.]|uniref:hypothetical protein n=1 Tax=Mucilaginibacter sp. TaxID=1882438 RepID=UPI002ED63763